MRVVSQRCTDFEYIVTTPSPAAVELDPAWVAEPRRFADCLFLLVGIQQGDSAVVAKVAKALRRIARKTSAPVIVVNGFSQLADPAGRSDHIAALGVLRLLCDALAAQSFSVHVMPFGWNKRWRAEVLDGEWEQRVTYIPPETRLTARTEGWSTVPVIAGMSVPTHAG